MTWEHMKTGFIPCYHKISSGLPKVGVLSYECRTFSCGVGVVCEACHTLEFDTSYLNLQPHFYTYIGDPCMIWLDSDQFYPMLSQDFLRFAESGSFELWVLNLFLRSRYRLWSVSHFGVWCLIFKPPTTLLYIYLGPMHDLVGFRRSEAPALGETLTSWSEVNHIVYPFDWHREGVDQWNCILGCVSVGHRNICQVLPHVVTRFPPVCRKWEFWVVSAQQNVGVVWG